MPAVHANRESPRMLDEIRWVAVAVTTAASAPGRRGIARTKNTFDLAFSPPEDTDGDGLFDADGGDGRTVTLQTDPTQDTYDRHGRLLRTSRRPAGPCSKPSNSRRAGQRRTTFDRKPFEQIRRLRAAERAAKSRGRGV